MHDIDETVLRTNWEACVLPGIGCASGTAVCGSGAIWCKIYEAHTTSWRPSLYDMEQDTAISKHTFDCVAFNMVLTQNDMPG